MIKELLKDKKKKILDLLQELCIIEDKESGVITITLSEGGLKSLTKESKVTFK